MPEHDNFSLLQSAEYTFVASDCIIFQLGRPPLLQMD